jgi:hypothetical protein
MKKFTEFKFNKINEQEVTLNQKPEENSTSTHLEKPKEETPETTSETSDKSEVSTFISKMLESREMAQVYHWSVKGDMGSHACLHLALEAYYNDIIELIDELVEVHQGQYQLIEEYNVIDTKETKSKEKVDYYTEVANFIKENRKSFSSEDTHIQNIIDEMVSKVYRLLYKLKYNK